MGARRWLNGKQEALLVANGAFEASAGRARWTLELLAGEVLRLTGTLRNCGPPARDGALPSLPSGALAEPCLPGLPLV